MDLLHPAPHAPSYIKGMINLRGSVLAIIDLAERLGLPSAPPNATSVVVVIEDGERVIGLLVDAVSDIITATEEMRQVAAGDRQRRLPRICRRSADAGPADRQRAVDPGHHAERYHDRSCA